MTQDKEEYLSPEEASVLAGVSRRTLDRYVKTGRIKRYRQNLRTYYKRADVQYLKEMSQMIVEDVPEESDKEQK